MAFNGDRHNLGDWDSDKMADFGRRVTEAASKRLRWIVLGVLALILGLTSYYQVEPEEVGVVTRFGQYVRSTGPGPHVKLPFWIERVRKVPVQRQLKEEFGFRTVRANVRSQTTTSQSTRRESTMLTGDLNVADVEWIVQYKVRDPYKYLFRVRNVTETFRDISEAVMRQVVGDRSVTEVLTVGREAIQIAAKQRLQKLCDHYQTGIEVLQLVLQDVNPPEAVRDSFNEVNQAIQERERLINQAKAEYNKVIPENRGKAQQQIEASEGYAAERVNRAQGEVQRFVSVQKEYAKAPRVTRTRLYLETLGRVLPKANRRVILDSDLKNLVPLIPLKEFP